MDNKLHKNDSDPTSSKSRRTFFKWAGQVTAGASLIGFGLANPAKVGAANPDCTPCPGPGSQMTVCLCPASLCSSNKTKSVVQFSGGCYYGSLCNCNQSFTNVGCCNPGDPCYCSHT